MKEITKIYNLIGGPLCGTKIRANEMPIGSKYYFPISVKTHFFEPQQLKPQRGQLVNVYEVKIDDKMEFIGTEKLG